MRWISIFATSAALFSARAQDDLPKKISFERYKGMLDHSPFAVASAVIAPAATPNFAKDLYVANAARSPDGDMVTVASSADKEFKKYLTTANPVDGYAISNIEWSDKVGETRVTISKDGQYATLTFNQTELSKPLPNKPAPGVVAPPQPGQPVGQRPPIPNPPVGVPTPHVRPTIQRNPQLQPQSPQQVRTPPPSSVEE